MRLLPKYQLCTDLATNKGFCLKKLKAHHSIQQHQLQNPTQVGPVRGPNRVSQVLPIFTPTFCIFLCRGEENPTKHGMSPKNQAKNTFLATANKNRNLPSTPYARSVTLLARSLFSSCTCIFYMFLALRTALGTNVKK